MKIGKVSRKRKNEKEQKPDARAAREEMAFLKSLEEHVSALQGAKFGADGLGAIHLFLSEEIKDYGIDDDSANGGWMIHAGLEEISGLLTRCLVRETNALERKIWHEKNRIGEGHGQNPDPPKRRLLTVADDTPLHPLHLGR